MNPLETVFALLFCVIGGLGTAFAIRKGHRSRNWLIAVGAIVDARVVRVQKDEGQIFEPRVTYRYRVDDREHWGRDVAPILFGYPTEGMAERRVARYRVGAEVIVRYDPLHPSSSLLEAGENPTAIALLVLFAVGALLLAANLVRLLA